MALPQVANRILKVAVLATALVTVFASNALANQIVISRVAGYYSGVGGEFSITAVDPNAIAAITNIVLPNYAASTQGIAGLLSFQTFCIEYYEHVNPPETDNYDVNPGGAVAGSGGAVGGIDPLSVGTEYLYQNFAKGTLTGYDYDPSNVNGAGRSKAGTLQDAIWYLEDELALANPLTNEFLALVNTNFLSSGGLAFAKANLDTTNAYNVFALNLFDPVNGGNRQSQLVYGDIDTTTFNVPDGGLTLMMLGVGLSGMAMLRRRLR